MADWIDPLAADLRQAWRGLRKRRAFALTIIAILALGLGGSTLVFGWVNATLLHPLANIPGASRLTAVETVMPDGSYHTTSYLDYRDYRDQNTAFTGLAAAALLPADVARPSARQPERAWGMIVSENYFQVLGIHATLGRVSTPADAHGPGSDPEIILSYRYWRQRFGGSPGVVGTVLDVDHQPFTIMGVTPRGFEGTTVGVQPQYYVPLMMEPLLLPLEDLHYRAPGFLHMIGRLKPGVTAAAANLEMRRLAVSLAAQYPATNRNVGIAVSPIGEAHYGLQPSLGPVLLFLLLAMALVLVIGCANVATLLLTRAAARWREQAVRAALGASRGRLLRQSLAEHGLMALLGGAAGLLLAYATGGWLAALLPSGGVPLGLSTGLSGRAVLFLGLATVAVAAWMVAAPALASAPQLLDALKSGDRGAIAGRAHHRLRTALVVLEATLAFTVLVTAGLVARSLQRAQQTDPGFATRNLLIASLDLRSAGSSDAQAANFYARLNDRVRMLPGVAAASFERWLPLSGSGNGSTRPAIAGYAQAPGEDIDIAYNAVGPQYFSTMRIPRLAGRGFTAADRAGAPLVCIVNESMAQRYWPGASPIGHRLNSWDRWWTVVGVVRDSRFASLREPPRPFLYFPFLQNPTSDATLVVRASSGAPLAATWRSPERQRADPAKNRSPHSKRPSGATRANSGEPLALASSIRNAARALDAGATVYALHSGGAVLEASLFAERTAAQLGLLLAVLALLLAAIGLYGVLSFSVAQRMREMGLRLALGAQPQQVYRSVVGRGLATVAIGIVLGAALAAVLARTLSGLLFGVTAADPLTWASAAAILLALALAASFAPARRATRADPAAVLRCE
ncbi:MAG: FtsX-like permease family protein [Acidobacteria bacterium]|nr:MAG: FtsX-like permease family protein [Acidobacteriota bacterium]